MSTPSPGSGPGGAAQTGAISAAAASGAGASAANAGADTGADSGAGSGAGSGPYDPHTALLVVDVQNDFADPRGSLCVAGGEAILPLVNAQIAEAVAAGATVVYTQDWHPPSTPHFRKDGGLWPDHCVAGSWGASLHPALQIAADAQLSRKGSGGEDGYSAFSLRDPRSGAQTGTGLDDLLRQRGIERVVIVGLATDYCVKETALDAIARGYGCLVLRAGIAAVNLQPGDGERALAQLARAGVALA